MNNYFTVNTNINLVYYLFIGLSLFVSSIILIAQFIKFAYKFNILDVPNNRSSHKVPTVRGGGIVIALLSMLTIALVYIIEGLKFNIFLAMSCSLFLAIMGFLDDLIKLSIKLRLSIQTVVSIIAVYLIMPTSYHDSVFINVIIFIGSIIFVLWSTNLCNFMDGTDGLTAVEVIFIFFITGLLLLGVTKATGFAICLLLFVPIIMGFLSFNWPPAKIFMGDVGSNFLGFLIGICALISYFIFKMPLLIWLILYSIFCLDATLTLLRRLIAKQKWYLPHRLHAYQRLQNIGWQHKKILYGLIVLNFCLAIIAIIAYYNNCLFMAGVLVLILLSVVYLIIEKFAPM